MINTDNDKYRQFLTWLKTSKATVAVSLSSGGAEAMGRNLALMEILTEAGIPYHELHGSSAGASVAGPYAGFNITVEPDTSVERNETTQSLKEGFTRVIKYRNLFDLSYKGMFDVVRSMKPGRISSVFEGRILEEKIGEKYNDMKMKEILRDLYIYAEPEGHLEYEVFTKETHPEITVHEAVRASISIPYFYEPKEIEGVNYLDGGMLVHSPLRVITGRHERGRGQKLKKPLVIFLCTNLYPPAEIDIENNLWENLKNRYFYKILARNFFMELDEVLEKRNVYLFIFYPEGRPINSFAFSKMTRYLMQTKKTFYKQFNDYINHMRFTGRTKRLIFRPEYRLP